jgi:hypothetical protein
MPLVKHTRTEKVLRGESAVTQTQGILSEDYLEFSKVRADAKLGNYSWHPRMCCAAAYWSKPQPKTGHLSL